MLLPVLPQMEEREGRKGKEEGRMKDEVRNGKGRETGVREGRRNVSEFVFRIPKSAFRNPKSEIRNLKFEI